MAKVYRRLSDIPKKLSAAEQLSRALDICSEGAVPDYAAFSPWLAKKLKSQSQEVPVWDPVGARQSFAASLAHQFTRLTAIMRHANEAEPSDFKDFLKLKLLMSFQTQRKRGEDVVAALLSADKLQDRELTEDLSSASPAQLRIRLFQAMHRDRGHDAFMILGRIEESDLDPGEYAFLRSLCHFRAGQYEEAIEYSRRVSLPVPDGPRAVEIRAKSYAYLGDGAGVKESISVLTKDALTTCQVFHLAELTAYHSGKPQDAEIAIGGHPVLDHKPTISDNDAGFGEFQKLHVRLLTAFAERLEEIDEALLVKNNTSENTADWDTLISGDPILQRTSIALALEPRLAAGPNSMLSLPALVLQSLYPSINEGDREALQILFQSLYRLGAYDEFITQFEAIWSDAMCNEGWLDLLALGYQVAIISNHSLADKLRAAIDALDAKDIQANAEEIARRHVIASRLTPMGREAYRLACLAIDAADGDDMLWRDAGLLALGFFRIIEVEFNERLIRPVANSIALPQLEKLIAAASVEAMKSWKVALKSLRGVICDPSERLMLGPLRKMCEDFAHPPPQIEVTLRAFIQSAFETHLTPAGRAAFYSQQLIDTISFGRVNSYRNPPAHGRFVGMSEAKTCQRLVNETLEHYFSWFADYNLTATPA